VREPLTAEESDRLSNAYETLTERLAVWTVLHTGLCVGELCDLTPKNVLWQERQLRFKRKGGPNGKKTNVRAVPMSNRVRALMEHHFALEKAFPVETRRAQDIVKAVANRLDDRADAARLRRAATLRLGRALMNRAYDALHAGDAELARDCLHRAVHRSPRVITTMLGDPRFGFQMAAVASVPWIAIRWFRRKT